jgi:hypothetical protein
MADSFGDVINKIMPLVKDGDKSTPFIIYRKTDGKLGPWFVAYPAKNEDVSLKRRRKIDPCAVVFRGAAFNGGSFAFVHDKILCARLRAEYNNIPFGEVHGGEMQALINAVEDYIGDFSQDTIDYLLKFDDPLRVLYDMNPIPLWNRNGDNNEPYIDESVTEFLEAVEYKIGELIKENVDYIKLTASECLADSENADFTKQLIIVNPDLLMPEYRSSTSQLVECSHGNGARPNAIGRSVFGNELYSGETVVYDRSEILGIADEDKLPQWAKIKLEIQRDPSVFEFGDYHLSLSVSSIQVKWESPLKAIRARGKQTAHTL